MGRKVSLACLAVATATLLFGCSAEEKVDLSQEKSPSVTGDQPAKPSEGNSTKSNPVANYKTGSGPGVGDALK